MDQPIGVFHIVQSINKESICCATYQRT